MAKEPPTTNPYTVDGIFVSGAAYQQVSDEFHPFHRHDVNALLHLFTTGVAIWGSVCLAVMYDLQYIVYGYAVLIIATTPSTTSMIHTAMLAAFMFVPQLSIDAVRLEFDNLYIAIAAIVGGYGQHHVQSHQGS